MEASGRRRRLILPRGRVGGIGARCRAAAGHVDRRTRQNHKVGLLSFSSSPSPQNVLIDLGCLHLWMVGRDDEAAGENLLDDEVDKRRMKR